MKQAILIHGVIELVAGITVFFLPHLLLMNSELSIESLAICKLYSIAAIFYGIISLLIYNNTDDERFVKQAVLSIMGFHMVLGFYLSGLFKTNIVMHPGVYLFHLGLFVIITFIYLKNVK
jgi:hypothetical protein